MPRQYRHEIKFLINENQANILKDRLSMIMTVDENGKNGYFIRSLYYDTPNNKAYNEKLDGVEYRRKYRIRMYNKDDNYIRLEKKIKDENMTAKEQIRISKEDCIKIMNNELSFYDMEDNLLKEFLIDIKTKNLVPSVIVDYDRYALLYPVSDVRVTFDYNIKSGIYNYNLFDYNNVNYNVLDDGVIVLEVKFNDFLPEVIGIILKTIPSIRNAFSKFAMCRSVK